MREQLHFAHGNGFPSPCYQQLLTCLQERFDCFYIEKIGHNQQFPVTENWQALVDELILSVKTQAFEPVIAVGHSLGGILSLLAAVEQPSLFKAVILLDSPLIGRFKSNIIRLSKITGLIDHLTPAFRTRGRQRHWNTREQVLTYLRRKPLFRHFTERCLNDYIEYGLDHDESGYSLQFDPEIEYQIYRTIPHVLPEYEGKLSLPSALIYGNKSNVIDKSDIHYMKKKYGIVSYETKGTHMFPMEHPEVVADLIFKAVDELREGLC